MANNDYSWIGSGGSLLMKNRQRRQQANQTPTNLPSVPTMPTVTNNQATPNVSPAQQTAQGLGQMQVTALPNVTATQPRTEVTPVTNIVGSPAMTPTQQPQFDMGDFFNKLKGIMTPQQTQIPQYNDPYAEQTAKALGRFQTALDTPFQYDPSQDVGLQAAQKQAQQQTMREFARKNLLGSMSNEAQAQLAAMNLTPQYQQQARQQYTQNLSNLAKNLELMQGMGKQSYERYRDTVGDIVFANQQRAKQLEAFGQAYNPITGQFEMTPESILKQQKGIAEIRETEAKTTKAIQEQEKNRYGMALNDTARPLISNYENLSKMDEGFRNDVMNNWSNLAILRDQYRARGDEEAAQAVEGARALKIISDPQLLQQYGKEFGFSNVDIQKNVAELSKAQATALESQYDASIKELNAYMKGIDASNYDYKTQLDIQKAVSDLEGKNIDNFMKNIQASYLEPKLKQDLVNSALQARNIQNQIDTRNANLEIARVREQRLSDPTTDERQIANDYYNAIKNKYYDSENENIDTNRALRFMELLASQGVSESVLDALDRKLGITTEDERNYIQYKIESGIDEVPYAQFGAGFNPLSSNSSFTSTIGR